MVTGWNDGTVDQVPIIDAIICYNVPNSDRYYLLICQSALYVPELNRHLIPPQLMREAGIYVNDVQKRQAKNAKPYHHSIMLTADCQIHLKLAGMFSYFETLKPTDEQIENVKEENIIYITPDTPEWNPESTRFAEEESVFISEDGTFFGNDGTIVPPTGNDNSHHLIDNDDFTDEQLTCVVSKTLAEWKDLPEEYDVSLNKHINSLFDKAEPLPLYSDEPSDFEIPAEERDDHILCVINPTLEPTAFINSLYGTLRESSLKASVGLTVGERQVDNDTHFCFNPSPDTEVESANAKPGKISPTRLAKLWKIKIEDAERTLKVTTQLQRHDTDRHLAREFLTNDQMLRYKRINHYFFTDTFFVTKKAKSWIRSNTCMQIFVSDKGFIFVVAMKSKKDFPKALRLFAKEVGVPPELICDASGEQTLQEVKNFCHKIGTSLRVLKANTQHCNLAELYVGLLKRATHNDMMDAQSPLVLWDYCCERRARINNLTARNLFQLDGLNPHSATLGETGDISNLVQFEWYQWCYHREKNAKYPFPQEHLGHCLGPSFANGNEMVQLVLCKTGKIITRRTLCPLTEDEMLDPRIKKQREEFDEKIRSRLGDAFELPKHRRYKSDITPLFSNDELSGEEEDVSMNSNEVSDNEDESPEWEPHQDEKGRPTTIIPEEEIVDASGKPFDYEAFSSKLINLELNLPNGDKREPAKVLRSAVDENGDYIGHCNANPFLDTALYTVQFKSGDVKEFGANTIAMNLYDQVNNEGYQGMNTYEIVKHRESPTSVKDEDEYVYNT